MRFINILIVLAAVIALVMSLILAPATDASPATASTVQEPNNILM